MSDGTQWIGTHSLPSLRLHTSTTGITIGGTLSNPGPPSSPGSPGDAWWDSVGNLWAWQGDAWEDQGNFRGPVGPTGPIGDPGRQGPTGPEAAHLSILGELQSPSDLPLDPAVNDAYVVGSELLICNKSGWVAVPFVGPQGPQGPPGPPLNIVGIAPTGVPPEMPGRNPGDAYLSSSGGMWVWNGFDWLHADGGHAGIPSGGTPGDFLIIDPSGTPVWSKIESTVQYAELKARIQEIAELFPELDVLSATVNLPLDSTTEA